MPREGVLPKWHGKCGKWTRLGAESRRQGFIVIGLEIRSYVAGGGRVGALARLLHRISNQYVPVRDERNGDPDAAYLV